VHLKRQVVKPMREPYNERIVELCLLVHWENSCRALRLSIQPVAEAPKGKWDSRRTVEKRRGTLLGVGHACGKCNVVS
jgi:hypothetical protein